MSKLQSALILGLAVSAACADNAPSDEEGGTTGGTPTSGAETSDSTVPNPTGSGSTSTTGETDDPSTGDAETDGDTVGTEGADTESDSDTDTDTDTGDVPVSELPFGGWIEWTIQGTPGSAFAFGSGEFYSIEEPDDPDLLPVNERPLGDPPEEHSWVWDAEDPDPLPAVVASPLDPGSPILVDGPDFNFTFEQTLEECPKDRICVAAPNIMLEEANPGGEWILDFPGGPDIGAATIETGFVGLAGGAAAPEAVLDPETGNPTALTWTPNDAFSVRVLFFATNDEFSAFTGVCLANLADNGSAEIPEECFVDDLFNPGVNLDPETYNQMYVLFQQRHLADVEVDGRRIRIITEANAEMLIPTDFSG